MIEQVAAQAVPADAAQVVPADAAQVVLVVAVLVVLVAAVLAVLVVAVLVVLVAVAVAVVSIVAEGSTRPLGISIRLEDEKTVEAVANSERERVERGAMLIVVVASQVDALSIKTFRTGTRGWRWMTTWVVVVGEVPKRRKL